MQGLLTKGNLPIQSNVSFVTQATGLLKHRSPDCSSPNFQEELHLETRKMAKGWILQYISMILVSILP